MPNTNYHSLQADNIINHFKIIRVLDVSGFGITYLAEDTKLNKEVVIKEYFPNDLALLCKYKKGRECKKINTV